MNHFDETLFLFFLLTHFDETFGWEILMIHIEETVRVTKSQSLFLKNSREGE